MNNAIELIMFDLDGTLVETSSEIANAVNDTLQHFGLNSVTQQQVNGWIGHGIGELMVQALAFVTHSEQAAVRARDDLAAIVAQFALDYRRHCGTVSRLYPQVREVIALLKARGVKLAVVTNKDMAYTRIVLDQHGLTDQFELIIGGDSVPNKKPDPAGVLQCLSHFGVAPQHALFIGDSSIDAATARNAGVPVWLLTYGYNLNQNVADCGPDRVIESVGVLLG